MLQPKIKIALVGEMLSRGGAERVQARLSQYFEAAGIEIHHVVFIDEVTYSYAGAVLNLGKQKTHRNRFVNKWLMLRSLRAYLKEQKVDFIIDFRAKHNFFQEYVLANFVYNAPYVVSIRGSKLDLYFPKSKAFARKVYRKCYGFVTVSKAIESLIVFRYGYTNVTTIYNPVAIQEVERKSRVAIDLPEKYLLGIGRMKDNVKQFDHLIKAFQQSDARALGVKLLLVGDGPYKEVLKDLVATLGLSDSVLFQSFSKNPFPYYRNALFTALTSKSEGFPNVLLESLATGTPVVAYNCVSGPSEIIRHRENGLLVEDQDISAMVQAMNTLLQDVELREYCRSNATESVHQFTPTRIVEQWLSFLGLPARNTN
ncbi:MAG: hypothetical protein CMC74_02160 [Flavobacteriaceae bacterium]|nr:hypothetical protein [Flavobacteriaceae bacterium]|tara:strand:- start:27021 stop:28130 length:1110 start_codon:yes stop_codon:yes gene_type:complete